MEEYRHVYIIDLSAGVLKVIILTDEEREEIKKFDVAEEFILTLEKKYGFRLSDCEWMMSDSYDIQIYKEGRLVDEWV